LLLTVAYVLVAGAFVAWLLGAVPGRPGHVDAVHHEDGEHERDPREPSVVAGSFRT
jgi:hypothetical protein